MSKIILKLAKMHFFWIEFLNFIIKIGEASLIKNNKIWDNVPNKVDPPVLPPGSLFKDLGL